MSGAGKSNAGLRGGLGGRELEVAAGGMAAGGIERGKRGVALARRGVEAATRGAAVDVTPGAPLRGATAGRVAALVADDAAGAETGADEAGADEAGGATGRFEIGKPSFWGVLLPTGASGGKSPLELGAASETLGCSVKAPEGADET